MSVPFVQLEPQGKVPEGTRFEPGELRMIGISTPYVLGVRHRRPMSASRSTMSRWSGPVRDRPPGASGPKGTMATIRFAPLSAIPTTGRVELATDPKGDASAGHLPDVTRIEVVPRAADDRVWFRMTPSREAHDRWMGVNVALDVDGDPTERPALVGREQGVPLRPARDRVLHSGARRMSGLRRVADAAQAAAFDPGRKRREALRFAIDRERSAFVVGVRAPPCGSGPAPRGCSPP